MAKSNTFVTGLIAGAIIGAVAGLLLAPKSGKETRKLLKDRASQLGEKASTSFTNILGKGEGEKEAEVSAAGNGSARRGH
jgi:gas vesicle protein